MVQKLMVFGDSWLMRARAKSSENSWAAALDAEGHIYLGSLRLWFDRFPLTSNKQKRALKVRLESFKDEDHRGAVNELSWWEFLQRTGSKPRLYLSPLHLDLIFKSRSLQNFLLKFLH